MSVKKFLYIFFLSVLLFSCVDDSWKQELEEIKAELVNQKRMIELLQNNSSITSIDYGDGEYTIHFSDGNSITLSNGRTPFITIGDNGNWFIDGKDTGKPSQGINGENGLDGITPTIEIGDNGTWIINGCDTGIKSEGIDAPYIISILNSGDALIIYFSDGRVMNVPVTNDIKDDFFGITGNEFWVKSYGNTFNQADYVVSNSEVNESSIILNQAGGYAALNKKYWSDRRIHRFVVTPTSLGVLKINMAQNTSNLMFSDMTAGGNWTSEFRIDMSHNKIYIGQQEFDSSISFTQGRKYIVELKYIRRIFYVTVTDFFTGEKTECVLDTSERNQNGAFKCFLTFENISGGYTIEQVETYLVSGVLLILFGDSVTESCGLVGKGENFSEIIAEKYGSVTIVAQGGAGQSSWSEILENEIKYIQPKYCSWHMGLNGGFSKEQVEQVISDCQNINTIPIINHVISYFVPHRSASNFSSKLNSIIDEIWNEKGFRGYYGDIATAQNNDIYCRTNYCATNSTEVPGAFNIIETSASYDSFYTYIIPAGKTVIENGQQKVLDTPLEVIMNIHPKAEGHKKMAERYFVDVKL